MQRVFLDSAPVIYAVEKNPEFFACVVPLFSRIDDGSLRAVISPVTLAECLVLPVRQGRGDLRESFIQALAFGPNVELVELGPTIAVRAAEVRAKHDLALLDAIQVATALTTGCEALLTNDGDFMRVKEIEILMISDYSA